MGRGRTNQQLFKMNAEDQLEFEQMCSVTNDNCVHGKSGL
jgi:hypothetical protein